MKKTKPRHSYLPSSVVSELYPAVSSPISGRDLIPIDTVRVKLGASSFLLWNCLMQCRDHDGVTHVTYAKLIKLSNNRLTTKMIERGFAKLRMIEVVEDLYRKWKTHDDQAPKSLIVRRVNGQRVLTATGEFGLFPPCVTIKSMKTWGGKRAGAGRKLAQKDSSGGMSIVVPPLEKVVNDNADVEKVTPPLEKKVTPPLDSFSSGGVTNQVGVHREKNQVGVPNRIQLSKVLASPNREATAACGGHSDELPKRDDLGIRLGNRGPRVQPADLSLLPDWPGHDWVCRPAAIPAPRRLSPADSPERRIQELVKAYRMVVARWTGKPCFAWRNGMKPTSKSWQGMLDAAEQLIEHGITPVMWAAFSMRVIGQATAAKPSKRKKKVVVPKIGWVFDYERIDDQRGWCRVEMNSRFNRRLVVPHSFRLLLCNWQDMKHDVIRNGKGRERSVVSKHFPADSYEKRLKIAKDDVVRKQKHIMDMLHAGRWLWR